MNVSKSISGSLVGLLLGRRAYTAPATVYLSAHIGDPGRTGANEVSGGGYARVAVTNNTTNFGVPDAEGIVATLTLQQHVQATGAWGNVTYFGWWDAASGGNFVCAGALTTPKNIGANDQLRYPIGSLRMKIT